MNYERMRQAAKKKLEAKKAHLATLGGSDRAHLEGALIKEAELEELAQSKAEALALKLEKESLLKKIEESDKMALELMEKQEKLELENKELHLKLIPSEENGIVNNCTPPEVEVKPQVVTPQPQPAVESPKLQPPGPKNGGTRTHGKR